MKPLDSEIGIAHIISCKQCYKSRNDQEYVSTNMDEWFRHKEKYPDHQRNSHVVVILLPDQREFAHTFVK